MSSKVLTSVFVAALFSSHLATLSSPAAADNLGAAIVGGIIGGALMNNGKPRRATGPSKPRYNPQRAANRETQTALNYFAFPAGTPDGVMGSRSRMAVSQYQSFMSFPVTGQLSPYERDFLVSSYTRAQVGGPQVVKAMQGPEGVRGLLHQWRNEATGQRSAGYAGLPIEVSDVVDEIADSSEPSAEQLLQRSGFLNISDMNNDGRNDYLVDTAVSGSNFWCGASHCSVMVFLSTPQGYVRNDFQARDVTPADFSCHMGTCRLHDPVQVAVAPSPQPVPQPGPSAGVQPPVSTPVSPVPTPNAAPSAPVAAGLGSIEVFETESPAAQMSSLTSHCSKVSLLTSSNGGYVKVANLTDPEIALGEQFCLARSYAINHGETLVSRLPGVTTEQIDSQCNQFGPAAATYLGQIEQKSAAALISEVQKFILASQNSLEQLQSTATICLYSGYRRDNMQVALGAALMLAGTGKRAYAELLGHHLALGFGVPVALPQAQDWYQTAVTAIETGGEAVFAPGQPERLALIKTASAGLGGAPLLAPTPAAQSVGGFEVFNLGE